MLQVNDYVVFGATGVCQVMDIVHETFTGQAEREYYVLNPVFANSSTIYVPIDNQKVKMRQVMTRDEITALIRTMPDIASDWIADDQTRRVEFAEITKSGDPARLVWLIKMLHQRQSELQAAGKKLSSADAEAMKVAEQVLHNEFALVLDINPEQVVPFIIGQIDLI